MEKIDQALYEVRVFTEVSTMWGIPSTLFMGLVVMSIMTLLEMPWFIGLAMTVLMFSAFYELHKDDPKALSAWFSILFSAKKFSAAVRRVDAVVFI
jgi:hypothetical protein